MFSPFDLLTFAPAMLNFMTPKNSRDVIRWEIYSTIFVIGFGAIFHFVFRWFGRPAVLGLFAPVNESVWEHLKMCYWPVLIFSIFQYQKIGKDNPNFFFAKLCGILALECTVLFIFYSYFIFLGKTILMVDILSFVIGAFVSHLVILRMYRSDVIRKPMKMISVAVYTGMALIFMLFTFNTPHLPIFKVLKTGMYGLEK